MTLALFAPLSAVVLIKLQRFQIILLIGGVMTALIGYLLTLLGDQSLFVTGAFMIIFGIFAAADPIGRWWFTRTRDGILAAHEEIVTQEVALLEQHLIAEQFEEIMDIRLPSDQKRRMRHDARALGRFDIVHSRRTAWRPVSAIKRRLPKDLSRSDKMWLWIIGTAYGLIGIWTIICLVLVSWWKIEELFG